MMKRMILYLGILQGLFAYDLNFDFTLRGEKSKEAEDTSIDGRLILNQAGDDYSFLGEVLVDKTDVKIDLATLDIYMDKGVLSVGRRRIGWGAGSNFQPTDIFNTITLVSAIDPYFVKNGRDSISYTSYYLEEYPTEFIYAFETEYKGSDFGIKQKLYSGNFDLNAAYIHKDKEIFKDYDYEREEDNLFSINYMGNLPKDFGVWFEGVYSQEEEDFAVATGIDRYFKEKFYFNLEYYRSLYGKDKKEEYNFVLTELLGEMVAKNYLIPTLVYEKDEKWTHSVFSFYNMDDNSYMIGESSQYFYNDYISFNGILAYQEGKDGSEYGMYREQIGNVVFQGSVKVQI